MSAKQIGNPTNNVVVFIRNSKRSLEEMFERFLSNDLPTIPVFRLLWK